MASIALPSTAPQEPARELPYNARIANAIGYVAEHYQDQPSLEEMAGAANLSPFHFQRVFKRWAGISPKRFLQYVTLAHAKRLLVDDASVLDAALDTGLSGPSRLHDLFVTCEAMTPGEFKALGRDLTVRWGVHDGPLGRVLLGVTDRGICWLSFVTGNEPAVIDEFEREWGSATLVRDQAATEAYARRGFELADRSSEPLPLLLRGTNFQIKVWEALLRIPFGRLVSYRAIAEAVGQPRAVRAVGAAVGRNNISWLIPCHRVILSTGVIHNYRWGTAQKQKLLTVESALANAARGIEAAA
ncbi:MAG TPA: methylated-DNA--[protein]-cysteine S-methyltransferase [Geminicoccaceae bacterium]|jgi:AraC family transcriptional regulator of adaptative response/methylated-DNA-[protein]-cysteine methyltransferase|nr:methylated-DNA--[protein]-cysteine S-methyltransferase [Geminicoccaceae bacterium]HZA66951.1 methylated-DNA--[protein]-cysteine S-methyltransferase [Geminicoccaceae bacterium]